MEVTAEPSQHLLLLYPKISLLTSSESTAVLPSDHRPALSQRGSTNFASARASGISHSRSAITAYIISFALVYLWLPSDKYTHMHKHTKREFVFLYCTCAQPHMHTLIQASHLFLLLNSSEPRFPLYITNTAAKMFSTLHSLQYWWYLDLFRWTYAAPSLETSSLQQFFGALQGALSLTLNLNWNYWVLVVRSVK